MQQHKYSTNCVGFEIKIKLNIHLLGNVSNCNCCRSVGNRMLNCWRHGTCARWHRANRPPEWPLLISQTIANKCNCVMEKFMFKIHFFFLIYLLTLTLWRFVRCATTYFGPERQRPRSGRTTSAPKCIRSHGTWPQSSTEPAQFIWNE